MSGRILVIDDEDTILTYLTMVFEDAGYEALSAPDADEGLAVARQNKPDLITLDIMMPKRSGISAYRELRGDALLCDIPVIFISGYTALCDIKDPSAFRTIVKDESIPRPEACFEKPIEVPRLLETVARLLGSKREEAAI